MKVIYRIAAVVFSMLSMEIPQGLAQPIILQQPAAQSIWQRGNALFTVSVNPAPAVGYQWRFNGNPLLGAQNPFLILQDVQASQAGIYDVVITNLHGASTSGPAPLTVSSESNDAGLPRIGIESASGQLQLQYWLQNTQGVYFILQSPVATNLWDAETLTNGAIPPIRQMQSITLNPPSGPEFYTIVEDPTARLSDFAAPKSCGQLPVWPVSFAVQQGVPEPLVAGQAFRCAFLLAGTNGAPLPLDSSATFLLMDGSAQPVSFPYSINPSEIQFTSGLATASLTINATNDLSNCSLALQLAAPQEVIIPSTLPGALSFDPANSSYASNLAQAFAAYRKQFGIASPVWGYPFSGGQRALVGNFGEWFRPGYKIHTGIDFADEPGTGVLAAEQGIVTSLVDAGPDSYIVIDHGFGHWTVYEGVSVRPPQCAIRLFDAVKKGDLITQLTGDHLHFEIRAARSDKDNPFAVNSLPGNAQNPQLDPVFQTYLFPAGKMPPTIEQITLTPYNPATHHYSSLNMTAPPRSSPGSVYVLVQAVDQQGSAKLAPVNLTFTASVSSGHITPVQIRFTDQDQAELYNPVNAQRLSDRGIALYSTELVSNAFSTIEKFRYWFRWNTAPYAGVRIGPRQITIQVDDGTTNRSPNLTYDFGPEILGKQLTELSNRQYQITIAAHLGSMTYFGRCTQADQYALEVIDSNGRPIPGVQWYNTQPENQSRLFTQHLQQESYSFTLPPGVDPMRIRVRATSTLLPDIADEISPSFPHPDVAPMPHMVWIPSGTFVLGSPANEPVRDPSEGPQTLVTLTNGFWMQQYEVTQREYHDTTGTNPSYLNGDRTIPPFYDYNYGVDWSRPVEWVSWEEATNYCALITARERQAGRISTNDVYRLPTEAEWEYACRAGSAAAFSYGPALLTGMANFFDLWQYDQEVGTLTQVYGQFSNCTTPAGSFKPNTWGLYDMHGNVWEWVIDSFSPYPGGSVTNPVVSISPERVMRGGSYETYGFNTRSARRGHHDETYHYGFIGFRMVLIPGGTGR